MIIKLNHPDCLKRSLKVLESGGIAILPCDTIYGLVGLVPEAASRLRELKGRAEDKPFLILIKDISWLREFSPLGLPEPLKPFWPGPLTIIFPGYHGEKTGLRIPSDPFLQSLLSALKRPLYSTSVNLAGKPPLNEIAKIIQDFAAKVDLIVDAGDFCGRQASTIIDISEKPYRLIRQGAVEIPPEVLS